MKQEAIINAFDLVQDQAGRFANGSAESPLQNELTTI